MLREEALVLGACLDRLDGVGALVEVRVEGGSTSEGHPEHAWHGGFKAEASSLGRLRV